MQNAQEWVKRIESRDPSYTVIVADHSDWYEVEVFNCNGLILRKRSFEPDFEPVLIKFINRIAARI